ncbi:MAG: alpha/beta hydrolase [Coriobacteriia bacterium]|jgi:putative phosphoribosyl transferase|nr:alpha/beta hydrolase [Coriobacteriia bacterium]
MTDLSLHAGSVNLPASLEVPADPKGIIVFAHGAGSSRHSPRNIAVAEYLRITNDFGTLLFDLLTPMEDAVYQNRFDIGLLTERLVAACRWVHTRPETKGASLGLFGASTGAAAALKASVVLPHLVTSVVSRGGRPDLAADVLPLVTAPTLLIVGGADEQVLELNRQALAMMPEGIGWLEVVPRATHLFEEGGALENVAALARDFFDATFET